jgi:hypothetical protein
VCHAACAEYLLSSGVTEFVNVQCFVGGNILRRSGSQTCSFKNLVTLVLRGRSIHSFIYFGYVLQYAVRVYPVQTGVFSGGKANGARS